MPPFLQGQIVSRGDAETLALPEVFALSDYSEVFRARWWLRCLLALLDPLGISAAVRHLEHLKF